MKKYLTISNPDYPGGFPDATAITLSTQKKRPRKPSTIKSIKRTPKAPAYRQESGEDEDTDVEDGSAGQETKKSTKPRRKAQPRRHKKSRKGEEEEEADDDEFDAEAEEELEKR
ncbi:hypothetical protein EDB80DRAFT_675500 [Ilyonectria destructans]|nr:hypothetical protein EDB80DRAFT_675500 [Ilyonectria destructans]